MWTNRKIISFINEIRVRPELWDVEAYVYKDRQAKKNSWAAVAKQFNISPVEAYKKFRNLRTYAKTEYKKRLNDDSGKQVTWFAFDAISFLLPLENPTGDTDNENVEVKKPTNDESDVEEAQNNTYQEVVYLYDEDSKTSKKEATPRPMKKVETQPPLIAQEKEREKKERDQTSETNEPRKRRRVSVYLDEDKPKTLKTNKPGMPTEDKDSDTEDGEIEKFGRYMICLMKNVPKELSTQLQMEVINLIMQAKMKYMGKPGETDIMQTEDTYVVMNEAEKIQHMEIAADKQAGTDANIPQGNMYEEVVYLQDAETRAVKEIRLKKVETDKQRLESEHRKRRLMTTHPDETAKTDEEEIDRFGKYVTCLMKTIPNDICTQLQMDIVNAIMKGKMKYLSKPTPVPPNEVIVEKIQQDYQPSIIMSMANETAHMPLLGANQMVASQA